MLVLEAEAGEDAERDPPARVAVAHDADQGPDAPSPEERLEGVHGQDAVHPEVDRRGQDAETGEELGEAPSAELAREDHRERDGRGSGDGCDSAQDGERAAEQESHLRVEPDEWRGIHVPPVEVTPEVQEVELVPEVAVAVRGGQVDSELDGREEEQEPQVEGADLPREGPPAGRRLPAHPLTDGRREFRHQRIG